MKNTLFKKSNNEDRNKDSLRQSDQFSGMVKKVIRRIFERLLVAERYIRDRERVHFSEKQDNYDEFRTGRKPQ